MLLTANERKKPFSGEILRVLHVMKELPYPPNDGFRADMWDRVRTMSRLGYSIHALVMAPKEPVEQHRLTVLRSLVERLDFVERSPMRRSLATFVPTLVSRNNTLATLPLSAQYDITLAETEHVLPIFSNPQLRTKLRVLRVHNSEAKYMWELAQTEERFGWKLFFSLEALRFLPFVKSAHRSVDSVWFISQSECQNFMRDGALADATASWLPPSLTLGPIPERPAVRSKRVLFVGGLKNPLNREGIRWYLKEVHPRLTADPDYELIIAGNAEGSSSAYLLARQAMREEGCTVHLNVADLDPLYDSCALIINPMRRGSGVKVKTIHAIQRRIPLVTTSVGVEGTGFADKEHVRVADEPEAFAAAVKDLLNHPELAEKMSTSAYGYLIRHYDSDKNIETLLQSLLAPSAARELALT
jgi:glycosyltransferase involved in cell wall biosynthesis